MMDVVQIVTDKIISQLESGTVPWHKPWFSVTSGPYNYVTKRPYSLLNKMMLKKDLPYASYQQWQRVKGQVRKGAKAEKVVFWKFPEKEESQGNTEEPDNSNAKKYTGPVLKVYNVFALDDIENIKMPVPNGSPNIPISPIAKAETLLTEYISREGINLITEWSNQAYYSPGDDTVHLPRMEQFADAVEYYGTAFHECSHSTGHVSRLNRAGLKDVRFGSATYSKEELCSELASASVLHSLGISTDRSVAQSASYIESWLTHIRESKYLLVSASSQAEKAVKYLMGEMHPHTNAIAEGAE